MAAQQGSKCDNTMSERGRKGQGRKKRGNILADSGYFNTITCTQFMKVLVIRTKNTIRT